MKYKKLLITGAGGFTSSHMVEKALKLKYSVTALVKTIYWLKKNFKELKSKSNLYNI